MWFNSFLYLAFFTVVAALYFAIRPWRARKIFLLVASYAFYASWNPPFAILLFASTLIDWWIGGKMGRVRSDRNRRMLLVASCVTNLGILAFFKYAAFLADSVRAVVAALGVDVGSPTTPWLVSNVLLPAGISFYIFQSLSYTIDVYRREIEPAESALDFFLFVSFFPQLVAGPIVRARQLLPAFASAPRVRLRDWEEGAALIILGLFQKMVMADNLAPLADLVFERAGNFSTLATWLGVYAFAFQIYFDFAGYSNIAIGSARILGFHIPENFRTPYISTSLREFWTRWHISLSGWIRDYLYVPLGGSRGSKARTAFNLFVTMALAGLWHGAAWTFVFWGVLHGMYLAVEHALARRKAGAGPGAVGQTLRALLTFHLVCIGWVFFRAQSFSEAIWTLGPMFSASGLEVPEVGFDRVPYVLLSLAATAIAFVFRDGAALQRIPRWAYAAILAALLVITMTGYGDATEFIYFRF